MVSDRAGRWSAVVTLPARRPWATLAVMAAAAVLSLASVSRMQVSARLESLVSGDAPATKALEHLLHDFAAMDKLLVLVSVPESPGGSGSQADHAAALLRFAGRFDEAIRHDGELRGMVRRVSWSAGSEPRRFIEKVVAPAGLEYLDDAHLEQLKQRLSPEGIRARLKQDEAMLAVPGPGAGALAKVLVKDPLGLHELISDSLAGMRPHFRTWRGGEEFLSPDARALLIRISPTRPVSDMDFTKALMKRIRKAAKAARPGGLDVQWSGAYAIAEFSERQIRGDMIANSISSVVAMQVLFLLAYRSGLSFLLAFAPVAIGVLLGFGAYGLMTRELTPLTAAVGGILAGMGIDYAIQYLSHYRQARSRGLGRIEAADISQGLGRSMPLACLTTLIGFGAVAISSVSGLRDFAVLAALGLAGAFVSAVVFLPALLGVVDRREARSGRSVRMRFAVEPLVEWLARRVRGCVTVGGVVVAIAGAVAIWGGVTRSGYESDLSVMHPQPNPPLRTQERITELFSGSPDSLVIHMEAGTPGELLRLCREVGRRLDTPEMAERGLGRAYSPASLLPDPDTAAERLGAFSDEDAERIVADFRAAVAQSAFDPAAFEGYAEFLRRVLRPGEAPGLKALAGFPELAGMVLPREAVEGGKEPRQALAVVLLRRPFADRIERDAAIDAVRSALAELPGATLTGLSVVGRDVEDSVRHDLPRVLLIVGAIVLLWVGVTFRSVRDTALVLMPAAVGMVCLFAAMVLSGSRLNLVNMVALPILAGTGVDNGIFLVGIAKSAAKRGREAMVRELGTTCFAVILCNVTTILGFGSLVFATTPAVASLGLMFAAGMAGCLAASVGLLTPLLMRGAEGSA